MAEGRDGQTALYNMVRAIVRHWTISDLDVYAKDFYHRRYLKPIESGLMGEVPSLYLCFEIITRSYRVRNKLEHGKIKEGKFILRLFLSR